MLADALLPEASPDQELGVEAAGEEGPALDVARET